MGRVKTAIVLAVILIVVPIVAEAGLLLTGLQGLQVGDVEVSGSSVTIPLTVPNRGLIDFSGNIRLSILDQGGSVLQATDNGFRIPAGTTERINLVANIPRDGVPSKVRVEMTITVGGIISIPIPPVETGLPGA